MSKFTDVLSHLDRTITELRRVGGPDLASLLMLQVVRRNLMEADHPEAAAESPYFRAALAAAADGG